MEPKTITIDGKEYDLIPKYKHPVGTKFTSKYFPEDGVYEISAHIDGEAIIFCNGEKCKREFSLVQVERFFEVGEWIEVKEEKPEYPKILSFMSDGKVYSYDSYDAFVPDWEYSLDQKHCTIHSVAKSENEVFTVGDRVIETITGKNEWWIINEFSIKDTRIFSCGINVMFIKKDIPERKPIFTTEDGVEIFEGDKCYSVYKSSLTLAADGDPMNLVGDSNDELWYFSTLVAAEKFIQNKPVFSREQIKKACYDAGDKSTDDKGRILIDYNKLEKILGL